MMYFVYERRGRKTRGMLDNENSVKRGIAIRVILTLFVAASAAVIYYLFVNMSRFVEHNPMKLELYYRHAKRFDREQKAAFLKEHAGLWHYRLDTLAGGFRLRKSDLVELKDNGIIWQVVSWNVIMPGDTGRSFYQVRTCYIEPYGTLDGDTLCDAFTIHQTFVRGRDTCFGGWNFLDLWNVRAEHGSLVMSSRSYQRYSGEPKNFFPSGMIDLVGLGGGQNRFFKKTRTGPTGAIIELSEPLKKATRAAGAIGMPDCLDMYSLSDIVKKNLFAEFGASGKKIQDPGEAAAIIERYHRPLFLDEQLRIFPRRKPGEITVSFQLRQDGTVADIKLSSPEAIDKMFRTAAVREIGTWRLPPASQQFNLSCTFSLR